MNPQQTDGEQHSDPSQEGIPQPMHEDQSMQPSSPATTMGQIALTNVPNSAPQEDPGEFTSNPFATLGKGLGNTLSINPLSAIYIGLLVVVIGLPLYLAGILLTIIPIVGIVFAIAAMIALVIIVLKSHIGMVVIASESRKKNAISTKEAFGNRTKGLVLPFFLTSIVAAIFIFVGLMLFIIPGLIIAARLSLFPFVMVNENQKYLAAIKRSFVLTKGHTIEMLGLLTAVTFAGSNGLLNMTIYGAANEQRYHELVKFNSANKPTGRIHPVNYAVVFGIIAVFILGIIINLVSVSMLNNRSRRNDLNNSRNIFQLDNTEEDPFDFNYEFQTN